MIKGFLWYNDAKIPVTWTKETTKYVYDVQRVHITDGEITVDKRIYDEKVAKKEIIYFDTL